MKPKRPRMSDLTIGEIRYKYISGIKNNYLQNEYKLNKNHISKIVNNKIYKDPEYAKQLEQYKESKKNNKSNNIRLD